MDIKKLLIGGVTAAVIFFLLGWLAYGNLFAGFFKNNQAGPILGYDRAEMIIWIIALGNLFQGLGVAYILNKSNACSFGKGLVTAAVTGFLLTTGFDFVMYATTYAANKFAIMADVAIVTVMWAVAGAFAGTMMGMGKKAT